MKIFQQFVALLVAMLLIGLPLQANANTSLIHLPQNRSASGVLAVDSYQYLWFSAKQNNPVRFTLGKSGNLWYRFKILDASATRTLAEVDVENSDRELTFAPPYDGNYYILLLGYYSYGKYSLRFENILATAVSPATVSPLRSGIRRTDKITNGMRRQYGFAAHANEPLRLTIIPEQDVWVRARIIAPDGSILRTEDIESGKRYIIFTPHQDGEYQVTIAGFYGNGRVTLTLDLIRHLL